MNDDRPEPRRPDRGGAREAEAGRAGARNRIEQQARWVDLQIQQAMARGEFDNLPGAGKPLQNLGTQHDPDWWVKQLIERERITGVLPPALQLRKDDAELDARLDRITSEREVREQVEEFNARVLKARYTPVDGPPLITQPRDVEATVVAWRERRRARRLGRTASPPPSPADNRSRRRRRWFRR